jgi:hypothetical protein
VVVVLADEEWFFFELALGELEPQAAATSPAATIMVPTSQRFFERVEPAWAPSGVTRVNTCCSSSLGPDPADSGRDRSDGIIPIGAS